MGEERELVCICTSKWRVKLKGMRHSQVRNIAPEFRNTRKVAEVMNYLEHEAKL